MNENLATNSSSIGNTPDRVKKVQVVVNQGAENTHSTNTGKSNSTIGKVLISLLLFFERPL
ncbi:hypothetical protein JCM19233_6959 [Vibrio astriarenae]|nr:hypothetical protein JCM19233_6959 [Vibrio sp. C7]